MGESFRDLSGLEQNRRIAADRTDSFRQTNVLAAMNLKKRSQAEDILLNFFGNDSFNHLLIILTDNFLSHSSSSSMLGFRSQPTVVRVRKEESICHPPTGLVRSPVYFCRSSLIGRPRYKKQSKLI